MLGTSANEMCMPPVLELSFIIEIWLKLVLLQCRGGRAKRRRPSPRICRGKGGAFGVRQSGRPELLWKVRFPINWRQCLRGVKDGQWLFAQIVALSCCCTPRQHPCLHVGDTMFGTTWMVVLRAVHWFTAFVHPPGSVDKNSAITYRFLFFLENAISWLKKEETKSTALQKLNRPNPHARSGNIVPHVPDVRIWLLHSHL